jgi:hypothetical protein
MWSDISLWFGFAFLPLGMSPTWGYGSTSARAKIRELSSCHSFNAGLSHGLTTVSLLSDTHLTPTFHVTKCWANLLDSKANNLVPKSRTDIETQGTMGNLSRSNQRPPEQDRTLKSHHRKHYQWLTLNPSMTSILKYCNLLWIRHLSAPRA